MLLDICLGTKTAWRILIVLAEAPGKAVSRKEIKQLTHLGNKVLTKTLLLLEKFQIVDQNKAGKAYYYKLNLSYPFTEHLLEIIRLEKKALNNPDFTILAILREFTYELTNLCLENLEQLILFGSHAKRTSHKDSDIDVAVILKKRDTNDELIITEAIDKLKKRFRKEIQPHYFSNKIFKEQKDSKLVQEIIKDGIRLL
ncbi:MAG: nucleotidyltransferase domain-containing protein [Candidatus Woesearchaeota archaeon]